MAAKNAAAMAHNKATKRDGFGSVGRGSEGDFYSPDEVRSMTQSEVKQNYQKRQNDKEHCPKDVRSCRN